MRRSSFSRRLSVVALTVALAAGAVSLAGAQSQEPKPRPAGTPTGEPARQPSATPASGVSGSIWEGPTWRVSVNWDPAIWTVEDELVERGYDGLQIGTPASTVFVEAYDGYAGDPSACLTDARQQIETREGVVDVTPLTDRPLPGEDTERGPAALVGVTARFPDGVPYRGVEYVECRELLPGTAVLEITWQVATISYEAELPKVDDLLATIEIPGDAEPQTVPGGPVAPASLQDVVTEVARSRF